MHFQTEWQFSSQEQITLQICLADALNLVTIFVRFEGDSGNAATAL